MKLRIAIILAILATTAVALSQGDQSGDKFYSDDYPGYNSANGTAVDIYHNLAMSAIRQYDMVYGTMPNSWADLEASGLVNRPLLGFKLETIDPDDASIDFLGDLYYEAPRPGFDWALVYSGHSPSTGAITRDKIEPMNSYSSMFQSMVGNNPANPDYATKMNEYASNTAIQQQYAMIGMLQDSLTSYRILYGNSPPDIQTLLDAGFGPVIMGSINPVTGEPQKFNGGPGEISYQINGQSFTLKYIDLDGNSYVNFS